MPYSLASKWATLPLVFRKCTLWSVHGGGEEKELCANSLSSLSSAPNDSWQTTNANPIWAATVAPPPAFPCHPRTGRSILQQPLPSRYIHSERPTLKNSSSLTVCSKWALSFKPRQYPALQSHDGREQWFKQSRWRLWRPHAAKHMLTCGCYSECHLLVVESNYWLNVC